MQTFETPYDKYRHFALPRRVLVATDLTDQDVLLPHAISQARVSGAHVLLIHASPPQKDQDGDNLRILPGHRAQDLNKIRQLEAMRHRVLQQAVCCSIKLGYGSPLDVVLTTIRQAGADLLIVGSRGRRYLREMLLGSTAKTFMAGVPIPLEHGCQELSRFALLLGEVYGARVVLMHVLEEAIDETVNQARTRQWAHNALRSLIDSYGRGTQHAKVRLSSGNVVKEACRAATELQADMVVVGTREPAHPSRIKDGLAYQIMAAVSCPLLCYRVDDPRETELESQAEAHAAARRQEGICFAVRIFRVREKRFISGMEDSSSSIARGRRVTRIPAGESAGWSGYAGTVAHR